MSFKERSKKSSTASRKVKTSKKSVPTSAEHIIDSDIDYGSGDDNTSLTKASTRPVQEASQSKGTKRKSKETLEPSTSKKAKVSSAKRDPHSDHVTALKQSSKSTAHLNGTSESISRSTSRSSPEPAGSGSSDSESQRSLNKSPQQTTETSKKASQSNLANDTINTNFADSSSARSESETEEESEEESKVDAEDHQEHRATSDDSDPQVVVIPPIQSVQKEIPPYRPPEGFSAAVIRLSSTDNIRAMLSPENLAGKQLWHITVPASIPISDIKRISSTDFLGGKPILTHKGSKYAFTSDTEHTLSSQVLIPGRAGDKYSSIGKDLDLHLHLRQSLDLRDLGNSSVRSGQEPTAIIGARKTKLEQPAGLKMRYRPFGDVDGSTKDSYATRQAGQRMDNAKIPLPAASSLSPKKSKKAKKNSQPNPAQIEWTDPQTYSAPIVVGEDSQQTIELPSTGPNDSQLSPVEKETPEARAKRKAEKAAKKEERRRRRQS